MTKRIKQVGLSFYIKIKLLDGKVIVRHSSTKQKIFNLYKAKINQFKWIYIRVSYMRGIFNDGKYFNDKDFLDAWKSFVDEDLIKEALTYNKLCKK